MKRKFIYFIENENGEWLIDGRGRYRADSWSRDPQKAMKFLTNEQAVEYMVGKDIDAYVTEHEFVKP